MFESIVTSIAEKLLAKFLEKKIKCHLHDYEFTFYPKDKLIIGGPLSFENPSTAKETIKSITLKWRDNNLSASDEYGIKSGNLTGLPNSFKLEQWGYKIGILVFKPDSTKDDQEPEEAKLIIEPVRSGKIEIPSVKIKLN